MLHNNQKMTKEEEDQLAMKLGKAIVNGMKVANNPNQRTTHLDHMNNPNQKALLG